jgi:hypothetical protein
MAKTMAAPHHEILEAALQGLEAKKQRLEEQIGQVRSMLGRRAGRPPKSAASFGSAPMAGGGQKRVLSPEARQRIAAAQKKRWAAYRRNQG